MADNVVPIKPKRNHNEPRTTPEERAAAEAGVVEVEPGVWKATAQHGTREYTLQMVVLRNRKRAARIARGETLPERARAHTKPITDKEVRERALKNAAEMFDSSRLQAVNLLVKQMGHKDPSVAQRAAVKVLEYTDGKPTQTIVSDTQVTTRVVYETAALPAEEFTPGFGLDDDADVA